MNISRKNHRVVVVTVFACLFSTQLFASPPPWAPAHGYRDKHNYDHVYREDYADDLGIYDGRCIYEKAGTLIGGVVGGVLGSQVGDGDGRKIAIVAGTILGAILGRRIGAYYDDKDRFCTGQALEHADNGQLVAWNNPHTGFDYAVTPVNSYYQGERLCRQFMMEATTANGRKSRARKDACRDSDEIWRTLY